MLLSCVLRLVPEALAQGRFAGTVQVIATGRTVAFGTVEELLLALVPRPRDATGEAGRARVVDLDSGRRDAHAPDRRP